MHIFVLQMTSKNLYINNIIVYKIYGKIYLCNKTQKKILIQRHEESSFYKFSCKRRIVIYWLLVKFGAWKNKRSSLKTEQYDKENKIIFIEDWKQFSKILESYFLFIFIFSIFYTSNSKKRRKNINQKQSQLNNTSSKFRCSNFSLLIKKLATPESPHIISLLLESLFQQLST